MCTYIFISLYIHITYRYIHVAWLRLVALAGGLEAGDRHHGETAEGAGNFHPRVPPKWRSPQDDLPRKCRLLIHFAPIQTSTQRTVQFTLEHGNGTSSVSRFCSQENPINGGFPTGLLLAKHASNIGDGLWFGACYIYFFRLSEKDLHFAADLRFMGRALPAMRQVPRLCQRRLWNLGETHLLCDEHVSCASICTWVFP